MKIGLDIDGVLCNYVQGILDVAKERNLEGFPSDWTEVDYWFICDGFLDVMKTITYDTDFWLKLKPLPYTAPMDFTPACYITQRPIDNWITEQWLSVHRFPTAEVIRVEDAKDKINHVKGLDLFVDDLYTTVRSMRAEGINAVLYEAPYQRGHDVSDLPKIKHLMEVNQWVLENRATI